MGVTLEPDIAVVVATGGSVPPGRPPEDAAPGVADSAPDTTAAYVGDVALDKILTDGVDDALDAPDVGARSDGGIGGHNGDRLRHVPNSADDDGEDAATGGPPRDCDLGADEDASNGGDPDEGVPDGLAGLKALPRPTGLNGLGAANED